MNKKLLLYSVLFLIFVWQQCHLAHGFISASLSLKMAKGLFAAITKGSSMFGKKPELRPADVEVMKKLDSLSSDFQNLRDEIMTKISKDLQDKLTVKTDILFNYMKDIQRLYEEFLDIYENTDKYQRSDLEDFVSIATTASLQELRSTVQKMHEVFVDLDIKQESIINIISRKSAPIDLMCVASESAQQILTSLYEKVVLSDTKALMIELYTYELKEVFENVSHAFRQGKEFEKFQKRIERTTDKTKIEMYIASREIWRCDPPEHIYSSTYLKVQEVFQAYTLYETDTDYSFWSSVFYSCPSLKNFKLRCHSAPCKAQPREVRCAGNLRDCEWIDKSFQICHSLPGSDRKYDWMKTGSGLTYGHVTTECRYRTQGLNDIGLIEHCFCNCESEKRFINRYFSLRSVTSDVNENKVVTGVRIVQNNYAFHIQIQQGILGKTGTITDVQWKEIDPIDGSIIASDKVTYYTQRNFYKREGYSYDPDYEIFSEFRDNDLVFTVTYDSRVVYLDDLYAGPNRLVTGVRFRKDGKDLRFEIQSTEFDFYTGELKLESSLWLNNWNRYEKRDEVFLREPGEPIKSFNSDTISHHNQFIRFRMSDMKKDLGQTTVPFIDVQEVVSNPPLPLSGAGLFHKGKKFSGGYLALKIMHYDFSEYIDAKVSPSSE